MDLRGNQSGFTVHENTCQVVLGNPPPAPGVQTEELELVYVS